ncbi:KTSC domain-containing protein [Streptomyces sp. NBC_00470]|uniref:KTSC domain-containing protein n=1 Tax=Streptomyces sp. NBC_00470 TaxID=2975753 RepID=UPI0030E254D8
MGDKLQKAIKKSGIPRVRRGPNPKYDSRFWMVHAKKLPKSMGGNDENNSPWTSSQLGEFQDDAYAKTKQSPTQQSLDAMHASPGTTISTTGWYDTYPKGTKNLNRPRTYKAQYDSKAMVLRIQFRDGAIYEYYRVPSNAWRVVRKTASVGGYINSTLNGYPYRQITPNHTKGS